MKLATTFAFLLCSHQVLSQDLVLRADAVCSAQGTVMPGQVIDTAINLKILLVQFSNVGCRIDRDGISPRYSAKDFEDLLGSEGIYVSPGMHSPDGDELFGSMNDYYIHMSGGRMRIHAFAINRMDSLSGKPVWVTLGNTKEYYQQSGLAIFFDAYQAAIDAGLDPSQSGNTSLAVIYAGNAYFLMGGLNPMALDRCYIMSELQGRPYNQENAGANFSRIGIHCHEFGHTIGIGHTTGGRADLMCGGTSNGSVEGNAPAPLNAIVRARRGWANVVLIDSVTDRILETPYSLTVPTIYTMRNDNADQFYFENRRFDQMMDIGGTVVPDYNNAEFFPPAGPHGSITQGIFAWRVTRFGDPDYPGYSTEGLIYASGRYGRTSPENRPSDTDDGVPFPGVTNNRLLSPWSDSRNPYDTEIDYFGTGGSHFNLFVPNTKWGSTCGMEILSEDRGAGIFRVRFYTSTPPNPDLASQPGPDSLGAYESRRTVCRVDSATVHQLLEVGGEIFYRHRLKSGSGGEESILLSNGYGGSTAPCVTAAGSAIVAVWQMKLAGAGKYVVLKRRSTDEGKTWSDFEICARVSGSPAPGPYPSVVGSGGGSVMLMYRSDGSSLVSRVSPDGGITWSADSPVPVGDVSCETISLAIKNLSAEALIAYASDSLSGPLQVRYDRFTFDNGAWGTPSTLSGILPRQYAGFRNPDIIKADQGLSSTLSVSWDAVDTYSGGKPVIISRRVDHTQVGSTYSVFKGASENSISAAQIPVVLSGGQGTSYARLLTMMDSASGASVSFEIGSMRLVHKGGNVDTIRLSDSPSDSLVLGVAGLMQAGCSRAFAVSADTDTLQIVAAMYGLDPGSLFADGHVGFEFVRPGTDTAIAQFAVQTAALIPNGNRRLALLSLPVSHLSRVGDGRTFAIRPFVTGLRQDVPFTASLAHVYSNVSEIPVDRIVTGAGENVKCANLPPAFALEQNYPNPCNPSTTIRFALSRTSPATLVVYNILGQQVATLVHGELEAGTHEVRFEGSRLASGMYIYTLRAGDNVATKKLLLIR
jgi:M6 family metalloprotease-like protein